MKTILPAADSVLKLLGKPTRSDACRLMHSVVFADVPEGVLLFHLLTGELLLLSHEEYEHLYELPALYGHWFLVPETTGDYKLTEQVRTVLSLLQKGPEHITGYTIFTTTECNARCFYCYEKNIRKERMSTETALETAAFIARNHGCDPVRLSWFGGEPLYHAKVIDLITEALREKEIPFHSSMISNAYLLDAETVGKAKELWNLSRVQITLDGTRDVYNRTKDYIYRDDNNPFETVLTNIGHCLDSGIRVTVRMNMTMSNADDLLDLSRLLADRFGENSCLTAYSAVLFQLAQGDRGQAEELYARQRELDSLLEEKHLHHIGPIPRGLKLHRCMADSDRSVTVLPDGRLGCCEHDTADVIIGSVREGFTDVGKKALYRERLAPIDACRDCFYAPLCIRLEKCEPDAHCTEGFRKMLLSVVKAQMKNAFYQRTVCDEEPEAENC